MNEPCKRLWIAGSGLRGSGYPNAWNTVQMLRQEKLLHIIELDGWQPEDLHLWKIAKGPRHTAVVQIGRLLAANIGAAIHLLARNRPTDITYVPYPSIFLLWLLSWVPARWRPRCICDAYITLWDAMYQDRKLGASNSIAARLLLRAESRALRTAEHVIVDTTANADHVSTLFKVPRARIHAFPLALPAEDSLVAPMPNADKHKTRILFVGTFVPLQGTTVIAKAIDALRGRDNLEFVLIGDGQLAEEASPWLQENPAVTWLRGWQPMEVIKQELARADICLGVFGGDGKAARVLPFKLYMALAAGKPIITQAEHGLPGSAPALPGISIPATAPLLAEAISSLASDPAKRQRLSEQSQQYFAEHLASKALAKCWLRLLDLKPKGYRDQGSTPSSRA